MKFEITTTYKGQRKRALNTTMNTIKSHVLKQKWSPNQEIQFYLGIITCDPSIYTLCTIDHPNFLY